MAKWIIQRWGDEGTGLVYRNLIQGADYDLGRVDPAWDDNSLLTWILDHAENLNVGDLFILSDGSVQQFDGHIFYPGFGWNQTNKEGAVA